MKKIISFILIFMSVFALPVYADDPLPGLNAKSMILMDAESGKILYERNPDEQLPIASVTKIMTMLLIMEAVDTGKISLDELVSVSERAMSMGGSTMFLETGEQLSVSDMLKGIAVASANDGTVAMAEHISGSEEAFVEAMNTRANELGMKNTHFVNTNGLDADGHYSSARDVALMSQELIKHKKIFEYTTIWMDSLRDGKFQLANTNKLIRFYNGANGLKTGSTSKALCCLSATAVRDNLQLISVVLGAPTSKERFGAASGLLDFGFANYSIHTSVKKGDEVARLAVIKGKQEEVGIVAESDCNVLISKSEKDSITQNIQLPQNLTAPIEKGAVVGQIDFSVNGEIRKSVNLVAAENIDKKTYSDYLKSIFKMLIP